MGIAGDIITEEEGPIVKQLVEFAETHPEIERITRGNCLEEGTRVYYLITPGKYSEKFEDAIIELDLCVSRLSKEYLEVCSWPGSLEQSFLGRTIWHRD